MHTTNNQIQGCMQSGTDRTQADFESTKYIHNGVGSLYGLASLDAGITRMGDR